MELENNVTNKMMQVKIQNAPWRKAWQVHSLYCKGEKSFQDFLSEVVTIGLKEYDLLKKKGLI